MTRHLYTSDEDLTGHGHECSDSDRYTLDNVDLLNLPVAVAPVAQNKRIGRQIHGCGSSKTNHNLIRCQRALKRGGGDDYPRKDFDSNSSKASNTLSKSSSHTASEEDTTDEKSLVYIYSDREQRERSRNIAHYDNFLRRSGKTPPTTSTFKLKKDASTREDSEKQATSFPFGKTPSGNLKISSKQVAFQTNNLSVLIADPNNTTVNVESLEEMPKDGDFSKESAMDTIMNQGFGYSLGSLLVGKLADAPIRKEKESSEYEGKATHEILDPELNLNRLGYTASDAIDWSEIGLPEKKNLYLELYARITNFTNADCKVYIDNEEFNCHLIVLQCYSEVFHTYVAVKKVELPSDKCSAQSFAFIYEWMITGDPSYRELNRENVLDIFNAAKYLKIRDLIEQCWSFIDNQEVFTEDSAFLLYVDAKGKNLPEVRELMLPRIQRFFLMLVSSQDWLELELDDVQNFLQSNYICVNCEMEVFMAAVRWLKNDWDLRDQFKVQLLSCVRFGNIAPWQLVDIKRNPDNPDFKELAKDPDICKMIDDGLAFVIIKYWYGQENDDYQHWNSILALKEPPARNWSGMDKTYFTYREFLIYLDQYRRSQMIEKSKPKDQRKANRKFAPDTLSATPKASAEKIPQMPAAPRLPTMDEFLASRRTVGNAGTPKKKHRENVKSPLFTLRGRHTRKPPMSRTQAARVIQTAFRRHLARKYARLQMSQQKTHHCKRKSPYEHLYSQPDSNLNLRDTKSSHTTYCYRTESEHMFYNNKSKPPTNFSSGSEQTRTPIGPNTAAAAHLLPRQQRYLETASLFLAERESVMVFGGIDPHSGYGTGRNTGKDIFRYLPDVNVWEYVGEMPAPRNHHNVAFLVGRVYVVGGSDPREDEIKGKSVVVDTVWSFDPVKRSWFSEGSLKARRKNFGLVVSKQNMYAIGGQDKHGRTLASVERYSPMSGVWEFQAPMLNSRMGVACTKHNEKIWAVGGMSGSRRKPLTDCVECYDIEKNQWTEISRLRFPRCFASLFSMSDRLYLIGGAGKTKDRDKTTSSVKEIDVWNEELAQWECKTEMAIPRHGHCVAYLGTQILIIGGVTTVYMRALSNTECYCTTRGTWVRGIACLPTTLSGHAAVTLPPAVLM